MVLKGQAQTRSPEVAGKGFHISVARPRLAGQQDGGHRGAQDGVTTRAFGRRRPSFVRIACTRCPLQIGRCGIPSRLTFGKRTGASINRTSHHHRRQLIWDRMHSTKTTIQAHRAQENLSSGGCSSLVLVHPQPRRKCTTPHWTRVLHHNGGPNQYKLLCPLFLGFGELGFENMAKA